MHRLALGKSDAIVFAARLPQNPEQENEHEHEIQNRVGYVGRNRNRCRRHPRTARAGQATGLYRGRHPQHKDADAFKAGVIDKTAPAALAASGGRYVIRTQTVKSLDGPAPERFVVISFDSAEKAQAWNDSPATKEITAARLKSTDSVSFMVEGVAN
jgi:uncharacterized protein (DUF1330 family)